MLLGFVDVGPNVDFMSDVSSVQLISVIVLVR